MKVSLSWLTDYIPVEMEAHQLADALTMAGLEVEEVYDRYAYLDRVVVGRIHSVVPIPDTLGLTQCHVDVGDEILSVVCGAPNVAADIYVPVALPGTVLLDGTSIKKSTIRNTPSLGMICSEAELGLGTNTSGIMTITGEPAPGNRLIRVLNLSDPVLDVDLTPNRPDCLSILGIAREVAAITGQPVRYPSSDPMNSGDRISGFTSVIINAPDLCHRYSAKLVENITVGPSPFWLQNRLLSVGLRPINNIVDITNFILMETGQPLHAFDFDLLAENRIVVRTAVEGEPFITLDGKERRLSGDMLMICDGEKLVAIGGVMGGLNSEIEPTTTRVLIEGARFDPVSIRKTSKKLGLNTEASHRFERGVDPEGTAASVNRAAQLMADIAGGTIIHGIIDEYPKQERPRILDLSIQDTNRLLGTHLDKKTVQSLLNAIDFSVESDGDDTLRVTSPSFRMDIERPEDLMEEIARLWGYNKIPTTYPLVPAKNRQAATQWDYRNKIRTVITGFGFTEVMSYSFISDASCDLLQLFPEDNRRRQLKILNPLTQDQSIMRTTLIPGLLSTMWYNLSQQNKDLKVFEIGKIFLSKGHDSEPDETELIAGLWTGNRSTNGWHTRSDPCDFFDIKGVVESLLASLGMTQLLFTRASASSAPYLKSGYSAEIHYKKKCIGIIGEIAAGTLENFDLHQPAFIFELNVSLLSDTITGDHKIESIPKFPATTRDITIIVDKHIESRIFIDALTKSGEALIENIQLFDVFEGDPIPKDKKSISFRVTYRSRTETLEDNAINTIHKNLTAILLKQFKTTLPI